MDRTGVLTPSAEIKQENRAKTFVSKEANRELVSEKVHRAMRADNSTEVISEKTKSQLLWYHFSGLKYSSGWPATFSQA